MHTILCILVRIFLHILLQWKGISNNIIIISDYILILARLISDNSYWFLRLILLNVIKPIMAAVILRTSPLLSYKTFSLLSQIFVTMCDIQTLLTAKKLLEKKITPCLNTSDMYEVFWGLCTIIQWMNGIYPTWYVKNAMFPQIIIHLGYFFFTDCAWNIESKKLIQT